MLLQPSQWRFLPVCIFAAVTLLTTMHAQIITTICREGTPATAMDERWYEVPNRFEVITELVKSGGAEVAEVSQTFSSLRDAVIFQSQSQAQFYWDYTTSEQFIVLLLVSNGQASQVCLRQPIVDRETQTSVIEQGSLFIKPSILLGFDNRNQRNADWRVAFVNSTTLRGIPVNVFAACFYVPDIQATAYVVYYVSDPTQFQAYLLRNQSIILQMDVTVLNGVGKQEMFSYNVFRYIPNPRGREERRSLDTPPGVYCPNRTRTRRIPMNIPDRVSANSEVFLPQFNFTLISGHGLYDTFFQVTSFEIWFPDPENIGSTGHFTETHDFATGLLYRYDHIRRSCRISDIRLNNNDAVPVDGEPDLTQLGDPTHLFLLDDAQFQYTGERRCGDRALCYTWIANATTADRPGYELREWHWATQINGELLTEWIPTKLVRSFYAGNGTLTASVDVNFFNYRRNPLTVFEIDRSLADCYRALGTENRFHFGVLGFTIANSRGYPVLENLSYLQLHIWETLSFALGVRPTRLSRIIVDSDGTDIFVSVTILDAPPRYGPVENPLVETSLSALIDRLKSIIDSNGLAFRARYEEKEVRLRARVGSLKVLRQTGQTSGTPPYAFWLIFIAVGIVIGGVGGFFLFRYLTSKP